MKARLELMASDSAHAGKAPGAWAVIGENNTRTQKIELRGGDAVDVVRVYGEQANDAQKQAYLRRCYNAALPLVKKEG